MATINEILAFAADGTVENGDVMLLEDYLADAQRSSGHQPGIARQDLMNTNLRQVTHMAAGLAQFIANRYASGVVDDGDLAKIEAGLTAAIVYIIEETPHDHFVSEITDLLTAPHTFQQIQAYAQTDLAIDAGAVTWDMTANPNAVLVLTEDVLSFTMTNPLPGSTPQLLLVQDATGGRACATPADIHWAGKALPEFTQDANGEDRLTFPISDDNGTPVIEGNAGLNYGAVV